MRVSSSTPHRGSFPNRIIPTPAPPRALIVPLVLIVFATLVVTLIAFTVTAPAPAPAPATAGAPAPATATAAACRAPSTCLGYKYFGQVYILRRQMPRVPPGSCRGSPAPACPSRFLSNR